jgi:hypothetical protein
VNLKIRFGAVQDQVGIWIVIEPGDMESRVAGPVTKAGGHRLGKLAASGSRQYDYGILGPLIPLHQAHNVGHAIVVDVRSVETNYPVPAEIELPRRVEEILRSAGHRDGSADWQENRKNQERPQPAMYPIHEHNLPGRKVPDISRLDLFQVNFNQSRIPPTLTPWVTSTVL